MKQEQVESVLTSSDFIKFNGWVKPDKYGFSRTASFTVRGVDYEIEWYCNYSELIRGEMIVPFDDFRIETTWPLCYKRFLQFYRRGEVCAVIPIEEYEKVKE